MAQVPLQEAALLLCVSDDVAVLKQPLREGAELMIGHVRLRAVRDIPSGHKIAVRSIPDGAAVRKFGQVIGRARGEIAAGDHVHLHNLALPGLCQGHEFCVDARPLEAVAPQQIPSFLGYARPGGRAGTRNYIAVISTVNCSASVCRHVRDRFRTEDLRRDFSNVDGIIAFTHKSGCAMDPGEPQQLLRRVLLGLARHPNISGCVFIGLGCETLQLESLRRDFPLEVQNRDAIPLFLNIQASGGHRMTVEAAVAGVMKLLPVADRLRRSSQPISQLVLAENCGGSDAYSGITANPALGVASDQLVRYGATSVLAETPEIFGAEHLLTRRAVSRSVGEKLLGLIRWWEDHARQHNASIDNNPSPGNKAGGLTNIIEKSLGAVAKSGQAPLMEVYRYADPITTPGLCFMDTPGYDPVSMTGLVAGGCTVGVFTTGRGSVYGCKPAPCIKVSSNTALYECMPDDIDINAGVILDGAKSIGQVGNDIFQKIIAAASGERTKSELAGIGDEEFAPWQLGPTF